jgi:hypothetical protein
MMHLGQEEPFPERGRSTREGSGRDTVYWLTGTLDANRPFQGVLCRPALIDENLDGLFAAINLHTYGRGAKANLVPSTVLSSNDGVGQFRSIAWLLLRKFGGQPQPSRLRAEGA